MKRDIKKVIVLVTCATKEEAHKIAAHLLERKLAACVNIVNEIESFFWWQGKIDNAREFLLIAKSRVDKVESIIKSVKSLHSYEVPEIIALPIIAGSKDYLEWLDGSVAGCD